MAICTLALCLFCEVSNAQTETKTLFQTEWSRESDRMYSKKIVNNAVIGDAQLRLWLNPQNTVQFTIILTCTKDKRLIQVITWKEGDEWASVESCEGREGRLSQTDLPKYLGKETHPLPRIIEVIRKKPSKKIVM